MRTIFPVAAPSRPQLWSLLWGSLATLLLVAACTANREAPNRPPPPAQITVVPANGTEKWQPGKPLEFSVEGGELAGVSVRNAGGEPVEGTIDRGRGTWTSRWALTPDTEYDIRSVAVNDDGRETTERTTFRTLEPESTAGIEAVNADEGTHGVALPIVILFTEPIENKAAVEEAMEVRTSTPITGAWHWISDDELRFRPEEYWPTGTEVRLIAHMNGVRTDENTYGDDNRSVKFDIGEKQVSKVDTDSHTMKVYSEGELVKTIPISAGDAEHPTSSGTFVAMSTQEYVRMDGPGYSVDSYWNVRFTWSGQFVHGAPWSVGSQGDANVSHGCINASPDDAEWFYDFTQVGDIITVTGTSRKAEDEWWDGWTDWNRSFAEYLEGSATGEPVRALTMSGEPREGNAQTTPEGHQSPNG